MLLGGKNTCAAYVMTTFAHVYLQRSASFKNINSLKIGTNETNRDGGIYSNCTYF